MRIAGSLAALLLAICSSLASAQQLDFVTDKKLCDLDYIDRQELGMTFDGQSFWEIEYYCELGDPLSAADLKGDVTHISAGYCEEPGALFPNVFVIRVFEAETDALYVYQGDGTGEPSTFYQCGS